MITPKIVAVAALTAAWLTVPVTSMSAAGASAYTVSTNPTSALPGATVDVTGTDLAHDETCYSAPYSVSVNYTAVGGSETSQELANGTTDSADGSVGTTIMIPTDAASSDASGTTATVRLTVTCGQQPGARHARPHVSGPNLASTSLTVVAASGKLKASPTFAFRGTREDVTLDNCLGGPVSASFLSYGHELTTISGLTYDANTATATGSFDVPGDTTLGPGAVRGLCWQTSYPDRSLFVGDEEEEPVPSEHGGTASGGNTGGDVEDAVAKAAHAVKAQPTFTG
jgi:hypothetical protein